MARCGTALNVDMVLYGISVCGDAAKNITAQRAACERDGIFRCLARAVGFAAIDGSRRTATDFDGVALGVTAMRVTAIDI